MSPPRAGPRARSACCIPIQAGPRGRASGWRHFPGAALATAKPGTKRGARSVAPTPAFSLPLSRPLGLRDRSQVRGDVASCSCALLRQPWQVQLGRCPRVALFLRVATQPSARWWGGQVWVWLPPQSHNASLCPPCPRNRRSSQRAEPPRFPQPLALITLGFLALPCSFVEGEVGPDSE